MHHAYIQSKCRSSMLRRKVTAADDTETVKLEISMNSRAREFQGPWLSEAHLVTEDVKGQKQWITLPHQVLMAIVEGMRHMESENKFEPLDQSIIKLTR